jgi:tetratricopeptide (TPR) repeat protein
LETAQEMLQRDPNDTSAQNSLAIAEFKVSYSLLGNDPPAAIRLASDSIRLFDQMIASKGDYLHAVASRAEGLRVLGVAQLKAGRSAEARSSADLALAARREMNQTPDDRVNLVEALILAGKASAATRDLARAESLLREARSQAQGIARPEELTSLIPLATAEETLGTFYLHRHRTQEARACYERVVNLYCHPSANIRRRVTNFSRACFTNASSD